jgi:hypothetical protein
MENSPNKSEKIKFIVYLDFNRNNELTITDEWNVQACKVVEGIEHKYHQISTPSYYKHALYLINVKYIDYEINKIRNTSMPLVDRQSSLEKQVDSADMFPNIMKRKLNNKDCPYVILERTKRKMNKDRNSYTEDRWELFFLSNSDNQSGRPNTTQLSNEEEVIFDQLWSKINDK